MLTHSPPSQVAAAPNLAVDLVARLSPLIVVSPHYDDAIFSCGNLLSLVPGSTVLTVYSGLPEKPDLATDWDRRCGFANAAEAMAARREENATALDTLKAEPFDLNFLDSQYIAQSPRNGADLLGDTLGATFTRLQPASVFFPLGLFHEDHLLVSDTLLTICHAFPAVRWFVYEDIPYSKRQDLTQARFDALAARGISAERFTIEAEGSRKAAAVTAYRSQLVGLGHADEQPIMQQSERYWQIHRIVDFL